MKAFRLFVAVLAAIVLMFVGRPAEADVSDYYQKISLQWNYNNPLTTSEAYMDAADYGGCIHGWEDTANATWDVTIDIVQVTVTFKDSDGNSLFGGAHVYSVSGGTVGGTVCVDPQEMTGTFTMVTGTMSVGFNTPAVAYADAIPPDGYGSWGNWVRSLHSNGWAFVQLQFQANVTSKISTPDGESDTLSAGVNSPTFSIQ